MAIQNKDATQTLRDSRHELEIEIGRLLQKFETDTCLTIDGVYLKRLPTEMGAKHGAIHWASIEVML